MILEPKTQSSSSSSSRDRGPELYTRSKTLLMATDNQTQHPMNINLLHPESDKCRISVGSRCSVLVYMFRLGPSAAEDVCEPLFVWDRGSASRRGVGRWTVCARFTQTHIQLVYPASSPTAPVPLQLFQFQRLTALVSAFSRRRWLGRSGSACVCKIVCSTIHVKLLE